MSLTKHLRLTSNEAAKRFPEEAVVRVWKNIMKKVGPVAYGAKRAGHSALSLRGVHTGSVYVSWWPGGEDGVDGKKAQFKNQAGQKSPNYLADKMGEMRGDTQAQLERRQAFYAWHKKHRGVLPEGGPGFHPQEGQKRYLAKVGQSPFKPVWVKAADSKIFLPGLRSGRANIPFGIGTTQMAAWWDEWTATGGTGGGTPHYRMASKKFNCSAVVMTALLEGGGAAYATPVSVATVTEPNQVGVFATKIEEGIRETNRRMAVLLMKHQSSPSTESIGKKLLLPGMGLWSYDRWKKVSALKVGIRGRNVRAIDRAVTDFHRCTWQSEFPRRLVALATIIRNAEEFVRRWPDSGRCPAMLELAAQVNDELLQRVPLA